MAKAYKLFRYKNGHLFPLYVLSDQETKIGEWIEAQEGVLLPNGRVKSRGGSLAFRPGWHCSEIPLARHIGVKENGVIKYMHPNHVWCEVEYSDSIDYQEAANKEGNGNKKSSYLKTIPFDGFYRFKTNPQMIGDWIIAGSIIVKRILNDEEVSKICSEKGYEAMPRVGKNPCF